MVDFSTLLNLGLLGKGLFDTVQQRRDAEAQALAGAVPPPPPAFPDHQVALFTRPVGPHRAFDHGIARSVLDLLMGRSLAPAPDPDLARFGRAWVVIPLTEGYPSAVQVLGEAFSDPSVVVLGSHSLVALDGGIPLTMVLLVGPPSSRVLALGPAPDRHGGLYAILEPPRSEAAEQPPAEAALEPPVVTPPPEAAPPEPFPPPLAAEPDSIAPAVLGKIDVVKRAVPRPAPNGIKNGAEPSDAEVLVPTVEE